MILSPGLRRFLLTAHVVASVGWIGAVIAFAGIAIVGLSSQDGSTVRGVYLVMEPAARIVLLPLAFAALLTGLIQSLGTAWGIFRHYWVVFKLLITVFATFVLLIYMETFRQMRSVAGDSRAALEVVRNPSPLVHSILALSILVVATGLAVFKPRGVTPWGRRKLRAERTGSKAALPSG